MRNAEVFCIVIRNRLTVTIIKCLAFSHLFDDEGGADEVYTNFDYDEGNKSRDWSNTRACMQDAHTNDVIDT